MAKRSRRPRHFVTKYPNHHEVVDNRSRRLVGKSWQRLDAIASQMLGLHRPVDGFETAEEHTVVDDRMPVENISNQSALRPTWHGKP